jgi:hypothetical protein
VVVEMAVVVQLHLYQGQMAEEVVVVVQVRLVELITEVQVLSS